MNDQHEARLTLHEGMHFTAVTDDPLADSYTIQLDSHAATGGQRRGLRPMKMLLVALGGCMGMDVISILRKKRQSVTGLEVRVRGAYAEEHPQVYTHLWVTFMVSGQAVEPAAVARAIELSYEKYCPVANLLKHVVPIETAFEIIEAPVGSSAGGALA